MSSQVWLGPGVVTIDGKKLFPGDKIIKKKVPSRTWENWINTGRVGEPPAEPIKAGMNADIDRLKTALDDQRAEFERIRGELLAEIEELRQENNILKQNSGSKNGDNNAKEV